MEVEAKSVHSEHKDKAEDKQPAEEEKSGGE